MLIYVNRLKNGGGVVGVEGAPLRPSARIGGGGGSESPAPPVFLLTHSAYYLSSAALKSYNIDYGK